MTLEEENTNLLRSAIQNTNTAFLAAEQIVTVNETHAIIGAAVYQRLADALTTLQDVARRTL